MPQLEKKINTKNCKIKFKTIKNFKLRVNDIRKIK